MMAGYRQFAQWLVLTLIVGLVVVATAYKTHQNAGRLARFHDHRLKEAAAIELGREVNERVQMAFREGMTFAEFEKAFGPVMELREAAGSEHAKMTHAMFHEKSRRTFYLCFEDGKLVGFHSGHGIGEVDTGIVPETAAFLRTEAVRTSTLFVGVIAWFVILIVGICIRRLRGKASHLLVAVSIVCGLCWFLAPTYSPTWRGVWSNDNLALFVFLLIASLGFKAIAIRSAEDADPRHGHHGAVAH